MRLRRLVFLASAILVLASGGAPAQAQSATATTLTVTAGGGPVSSIAAQTLITLTATVTAGGAPVTPGQVNFCTAAPPHCTDIHLLGTAQLDATGHAVFRFLPGEGQRSYVAAFAGTHTDSASASQASMLNVGDPAPVTIQSGGVPGQYSIGATVTGTGPSAVMPTGAVSILDTNNANYNLGSSTLVPESGSGAQGTEFLLATGTITPGLIGGKVIADFNGDGIPDVAELGSSTSGLAEVALGKGDGSFSPGIGTWVINQPGVSIAAADFNQDGKMDLAITAPSYVDGSPVVYILLGQGDGTFDHGTLVPDNGINQITIGDFNEDGIPDILLTVPGISTSPAVILFGKGDGNFTAGPSFTITSLIPPVVGDFNRDGHGDLAVLTSATTLSILLGHGDGTFTASPVTTIASNNVVSLIAADLNGDGSLDLVAPTVDGDYIVSLVIGGKPLPPLSPAIYVLLGKGDGTFQPPAAVTNAELDWVNGNGVLGATPIVVGDFDGDGIADLAVFRTNLIRLPGAFDTNIGILLGKGDGSFPAPPTVIGSLIETAAAADFNGDGYSDLLVLDYGPRFNPTPRTGFSVYSSQPAFTEMAFAEISNINIVGTGPHLVEASFPGDSNYGPAVSRTIALIAQPVPTSLTLTASATSSNEFQPVTLTATVAPNSAQNHTPTGPVTFLSGTAVVGTASVNVSGLAVLTTTKLPAGNLSLTASYAGDINFSPSATTGAPVALPVILVDFTLTLANPTLTLQSQHHTTTNVTFASINGFTDSIAVACGQLPKFVTCTPTPASTTLAANGTATVSLYIDTDVILGFAQNKAPSSPLRKTAPLAIAVLFWSLGLASGIARLRRARMRPTLRPLLLALLSLGSIGLALTLTGCGEIILPPSSTTPGTYTIPITANAATTGVAHTANLTLTITPAAPFHPN